MFKITQNGIQSNSTEINAHSFVLWIPCSTHNSDTQIWEFNIELGINTSSLNKLHFGYLHSDSSESYFQIGNTKDQLYFKQKHSDTFLGIEKAFDKAEISYKIQLIKCDSLLFIRMFPRAPDTPYIYQLKLQNTAIKSMFWRIFQSGKTAIGKHLISQLFIGTPIQKRETFILQNAKILHAKQLQFSFNKPLLGLNDVQILINNKRPERIEFDANYQVINVFINQEKRDTFLVQFRKIQSHYFSSLDTQFQMIGSFPKFPKYGDLRFSEILFDAIPSYGSLPEVEYIELENLSNNWIALQNSVIQINAKNYTLPAYQWDTGKTHLIISPNCNAYAPLPCLELPFNLLNTANTLVLRDVHGELLDSIDVLSIQHHALFQDGGVSLEAPQESAPLGNSYSWYSNSEQGGSPGTYGTTLYQAIPQKPKSILQLIYQSPFLYLEFLEPLKPAQWIYIYSTEKIDSVFYTSGYRLFHKFKLSNDTLTIKFMDRFQLQQTACLPVIYAGKSTIEITEIYFEGSQNSDFIEIVNTGNYALSYSDLDLLIYDTDNRLKQIVPLINPQKNWLIPNEYVVITENKFPIIRNFDSICLHQILEIKTFPNLSIQGGAVEMVHHLYGRIDKAPFNRSMHSQALRTEVSLEKKSVGLPSAYTQNWMSCLTLAYPYSPTQGRNLTSMDPKVPFAVLKRRRWFLFESEPMFPIQFNFPSEGYLLYISLFDAWGNPIALILNGLPMPKSAVYPLLLEDLPRIYQSGNYVLKFEALHIQEQQRIRQIERISIYYDP